jgi:hypothetical protein
MNTIARLRLLQWNHERRIKRGKGPVKSQNLHYSCNANAGPNDLIVSF